MMMSRLGFLKRKHTRAIDLGDIEDPFVQINFAGMPPIVDH